MGGMPNNWAQKGVERKNTLYSAEYYFRTEDSGKLWVQLKLHGGLKWQ